MISINELTKKIILISGKKLSIRNIEGPTGVRGRNSSNELIFSELNWKPTLMLEKGLLSTYEWILDQSMRLHNIKN